MSELERIAKSLEALRATDLGKLADAVRAMEQDVRELSGKVEAIGDWIQAREAERAPEMQRPAAPPKPATPIQPAKPPTTQPSGPDFEAIGWLTGSGASRRPADRGESGWAFAEPSDQYDSRERADLKDDLGSRIRLKGGPVEVSMAGTMFRVEASQGKDGRWYFRRTRLEASR